MNFTLAELMNMVNAILVAAGEYQDFRVGLGKADITPDGNTVLADHTAPVGTWYAKVNRLVADEPHWTAPYIVPGPNIEVAGLQTVSWLYSGSSDPETIYTYFVEVDVGGTPRYVGGGRLATPIVMGQVGDAIVLTPQLRWPLLEMPGFAEIHD